MKRCKVCGTSYQDKAEFCLKCNLPLAPSTVNKPEIPKHKELTEDSQKLEEKIQHDFIKDISKELVKVSLQHPLTDNSNIKKYFESQSTKDFKDSIGYSSTDLEIVLGEITLPFQLFILSNVRIVTSTRNEALKDSLMYIIVHFFERTNLETARKQLIGIDTFVEEHARNTTFRYPLAIIGLENDKSSEHPIEQQMKNDFQFDFETFVSKITGLQERFIIKYFDFSSTNIINFTELGKFYFERFVKDQKVPTFKEN